MQYNTLDVFGVRHFLFPYSCLLEAPIHPKFGYRIWQDGLASTKVPSTEKLMPIPGTLAHGVPGTPKKDPWIEYELKVTSLNMHE